MVKVPRKRAGVAVDGRLHLFIYMTRSLVQSRFRVSRRFKARLSSRFHIGVSSCPGFFAPGSILDCFVCCFKDGATGVAVMAKLTSRLGSDPGRPP